MLPGTLRELGDSVFNDCENLRVVWVGDGCQADVRRSVSDAVRVLPAK